MCGIVGCVGGAWLDRVQRMVDSLVHRGPDDQGVHVDRSHAVALGHVRLSIIDLSPAGHQPMTDRSGRYTVVYNGEIYNHLELRSELEAQGVRFRGHSDTEVLLELFARLGHDALVRLNGMFALAVWDSERRELLLARDALGVKPLYFTAAGAGLAFASELKALLPVLPQRTLDSASLHRYLSFLWCPGEGTPLLEVRQLRPGEALRTDANGRILARWRWYRLPAEGPAAELVAPADTVDRLTSTLRDAVHRQLVADVPVGAFLSGGLDSSAVVAMARERQPDLRCFTIELVGGNDPGFADDLPYARRVAKHLDLKLDIVTVDTASMASGLEDMVWLLDEPLADPAPLNVLHICRLARAYGIKVMLSGTGGDDLFTGYRRHTALRFERWWNWLPLPVQRALSNGTRALSAGSAVGRRIQRLFSSAAASRDDRIVNYFTWIPEPRLRDLYGPVMRTATCDSRAGRPMLEFLASLPEGLPPLERMLALEQQFYLPDHNLAYTDRMSMAVGVETRVPFLDLELVDLAARLPAKVKQRGAEVKWVLKKAMEPYLPHDVIYRPKTGFGAPLRRWLRGELRPLVDELLSPATLHRRGLFDPSAVAALRRDDAAGRIDAAYTLLSMMTIEIWCRRFVDAQM